MPTDPIYLLRILDHARRFDATVRGSTLAAPAAERHADFTHTPGDRVLDLVTGKVGTIDTGTHAAQLVRAPKPHLD